jgi:nucleoside-diphosphate-sugar epimerase
VARGHTVVALARRPDQHEQLRKIGVTPAGGSLENQRALTTALAGVDLVFHVAGATSARNEAEFFSVNEGGTRRLLDAVRNTAPGITRFVYISSQAALGPSAPGTPSPEDTAAHPVTPYGRSKHAGELAVRGSELPWTIVRPSSVYGPRDREFLRLFRIAKRGLAPVFGTGSQELSLLHISDLVDLIIASSSDMGLRQIFHAAHGEVVLSRDVARAAGTSMGGSPIVIPVPGLVATGIVGVIGRLATLAGQTTVLSPERLAEFLAPSWLLDVSKAKRLLGWSAKLPMLEGMKRTGAWYKEAGWL